VIREHRNQFLGPADVEQVHAAPEDPGVAACLGQPATESMNRDSRPTFRSLHFHFGVVAWITTWCKVAFQCQLPLLQTVRSTTSQVDIGGFFPGDTLGIPIHLRASSATLYLVAGLTRHTSNTTNDFHFSYLRNFWSWPIPVVWSVPPARRCPGAFWGEFH